MAVPFGVLGTVLAWLVLPRSPIADPAQAPEHFDWLGAALLGPAVGLVLLGFTYGSSWGIFSPALVSTMVLAVALLGLLVYVERRSVSPLIDLALIRVR